MSDLKGLNFLYNYKGWEIIFFEFDIGLCRFAVDLFNAEYVVS
jgi:hypothetical protein